MSSPVSIDKLATAIQNIYISDTSQAENLIQEYLEKELQEFSQVEKLTAIKRLTQAFEGRLTQASSFEGPGENKLSEVFSRFLGEKISEVDLSSQDLLERLAEAINTVLDTLNEIVRTMGATLCGNQGKTLDKTIRGEIIGMDPGSLEEFLDQIKRSFLIAHQAFQKAARAKVLEILEELDPERITDSQVGGFKPGPLKKAGFFDVYEDRFQRVRRWFDSEEFRKDLLREFEKTCQDLYK